MQILQSFAVAGDEDGKNIRSSKDQAIYVGMVNPTNRLATVEKGDGELEENGKINTQKEDVPAEGSQQNKYTRKIEDGLLLVVTARIYGRPVRALIDSSATRCFVTPTCVAAVGLKGTPRDIFLE